MHCFDAAASAIAAAVDVVEGLNALQYRSIEAVSGMGWISVNEVFALLLLLYMTRVRSNENKKANCWENGWVGGWVGGPTRAPRGV